MPDRYDDSRRPSFTLATLIGTLPALIVGLALFAGAVTLAVYALPFASKTSAEQTTAQLTQTVSLLNRTIDQVNALAMNQAVMQEAVKTLANQQLQLDDLRNRLQQQAIRLERLDGQVDVLQADSKAESSIRAARRVRQ